MTDQFNGEDSHFSIAMPNGDTCRIYTPFQVYATDDGGEIVRFNWAGLNAIYEAIDAHLESNKVQSIESPYLPGPIEMRETLTDLPHSPQRTQLPHLDLSALRVY
jgi:hypothetical protein